MMATGPAVAPGNRAEVRSGKGVDVALPDTLLNHVDALIHRFQRAATPPIAALDLDNTLLTGDIGEAVYATMLQRRRKVSMTWRTYRYLATVQPEKAWTGMVRAMAGMRELDVVAITKECLRPGAPGVGIDGEVIPIPRPHPGMAHLVDRLHQGGFRVYVASASNDWSVKVAASMFGIPAERAFGIRSRTVGGILTSELAFPWPVGEGKVRVLQQSVRDLPLLITAGDSRLDSPLLKSTHPSGFSVWRGRQEPEGSTDGGPGRMPHPVYIVP